MTRHSAPGRPAPAAPRQAPGAAHPAPAAPRPPQPREAVQRWRLVLARAAADTALPQRGELAAWESALAGSGLPVAGLDGSPPKARFALAGPLAPAIRGEAELLDLWLVERTPRWRLCEVLRDRLPPGYRLVDAFDAWLGEAALPGQVVASTYRVELRRLPVDLDRLRAAAAGLMSASTLPRSRRKGEGTVAYDLRPFLAALEVVDSGDPERTMVRMTLRHDAERGVGRPDEAVAALGERLGVPLPVTELVREGLVLVSTAGGAPGRARTGAPGPGEQRPRPAFRLDRTDRLRRR